MTEHMPTPDHLTDSNPEQPLSLEDQIRHKFVGVATSRLIQRMEHAQDFKYDDEAVELNRRLAEQNQTWRWSGDFYNPRVEINDIPETPTDELIQESVERVDQGVIDHATARAIAAALDPESGSAMDVFVQTGELLRGMGLSDELVRHGDRAIDTNDYALGNRLARLAHYFMWRDDRAPVERWSELELLRTDEATHRDEFGVCVLCGEKGGHGVGCFYGGTEVEG